MTVIEKLKDDLANAEDQINIEKSIIEDHKNELIIWEIEKKMILDKIELVLNEY